MRKAVAKSVRVQHRTVRPEDRLLKHTWSRVARRETAMLKAATDVVESVPAPVDVIDGALAFATKTLKAQRELLVPLLERVTPKMTRGRRDVVPVADAVASAYGLAERMIETQRKAFYGFVETVTPPMRKHAVKAAAVPRTRTPKRTVRRGARRVAARPAAVVHAA
jgi:hypothetical protein